MNGPIKCLFFELAKKFFLSECITGMESGYIYINLIYHFIKILNSVRLHAWKEKKRNINFGE